MKPLLEQLEDRTLFDIAWAYTSGSTMIAYGGLPQTVPYNVMQDPVIQADVAAIQAASQKLAADKLEMEPILAADLRAIRIAIRSVNLIPFRDQIKNDRITWQATLKADRQAITLDRKNKDFAQLAIDKAKLKADKAAFTAVMKADRLALKNAVNNDPAVIACRTQYKNDNQIVINSQAALNVTIAKFIADQSLFLSTHPSYGPPLSIGGSIGENFIFGIATGSYYSYGSNVLAFG